MATQLGDPASLVGPGGSAEGGRRNERGDRRQKDEERCEASSVDVHSTEELCRTRRQPETTISLDDMEGRRDWTRGGQVVGGIIARCRCEGRGGEKTAARGAVTP